MKKGINLFFLLCLILGISTSFAATLPKNATNKIVMTAGTPDGVVIKKNKVTLRSGYTINRVSDSKATVMAKKKDGTGPISGEFTCGCQSSSASGSCKLVIDGTSIWCSVGTCGSSCQMTVSIPTVMNTIQ